MMFKLRRSSSLLFLFFVVFSATVLFLSVRQLCGEDSGISGGAQGSTSIVTGTDEECKEPGGASTVDCVTQVHAKGGPREATITSYCTESAALTVPTSGSIVSVGSTIEVAASVTNTSGTTTQTYYCTFPGCTEHTYPDPPTTHTQITWPTLTWTAGGCGNAATGTIGTGPTSFTATAASTSVNSSYVELTGSAGSCQQCGTLTPIINPYKTEFTVVEVASIDVWDSNGRHAVDGLLQVVPPSGGEDINGLATISPSTDTLPVNFPKWSYLASNQFGINTCFAKGAAGWNSIDKILKNVTPKSSEISCEGNSVSIPIYPYTISQFEYKDVQVPATLTATLNTLLEFFGKEGTALKDVFSEGTLRNQWKEKPNNLSVWIYSSDYKLMANVEIKVDITKLSVIKAVVEKILRKAIIKKLFKKAEFSVYLKANSAIGQQITFNKTIEGEYITNPQNSISTILVGLGGEAALVPKKGDTIFSADFSVEGNDTVNVNFSPWANDSGFGLNYNSNQKIYICTTCPWCY